LLTAGLMHGAVYGLTRFRTKRFLARGAQAAGDEPAPVGSD
jgi:hypothetical protein